MKDYYYEPICYEFAKSLYPAADERDTYYLINDTSEVVLVVDEHDSNERHTIRLDSPRPKESSVINYNDLFGTIKHHDFATPISIGLIVATLVISVVIYQFI